MSQTPATGRIFALELGKLVAAFIVLLLQRRRMLAALFLGERSAPPQAA